MKQFPYHKQETNYTCGAAAMRMILEFLGIKKSEKQIAKLLSTNKVRGTWHKNFPIVALKFKLNYLVMKNAQIKDLKLYQKKGYKIVICYFYPKEKVDHYSVLKKINQKFIYFWDPFFGNNHKYTLNYFNKIWKSNPRYENEKHWFFAVKK